MNEQDLALVEDLSVKLYSATNNVEREQASLALQAFLQPTNLEVLTQTQHILDNSSSPYAQLLASTSLSKIVTEHWNTFNPQARMEMRNYILSFLGTKGFKSNEYVIKALLKVLCLIIKLAWFDTEEHGELVAQITKFLQASAEHCVLGLRIFGQLVGDMNQRKVGGLTLANHRRVATSFRDACLLDIFRISLTTISQLISKTAVIGDSTLEDNLKDCALYLALESLSFDFIGTAPDDASNDTATIQIPSAWCPLIQDPATLALFLDLYLCSKPPRSTQALQCLVQLSSVRRSLFSNEDERGKYLNHLIKVILHILQTQSGLSELSNHHEICRVLTRLKANYQLSHIIGTDSYTEWIVAVAGFTCNTFKAWQWAPNSMFYLLALWARLVSSTTYLKSDVPDRMDVLAPQVMEAYIESRLNAGAYYHGELGEDPLDDADMLREQLENVPPIGRMNYLKTFNIIVSQFDPLAQTFQQNPKNQSNASQMSAVEAQLAWLVYIMGAVVGGRLSSNNSEESDAIDGELSSRAFQLMVLNDQRVKQGGTNAMSGSPQLEGAFLFFISQFRNMYIGENSVPTSKLYKKLSELLGLSDHVMVMNLIVTKIVTNLKYWAENDDVVTRSLRLFDDLASGYTTSKILAKMDIVGEILEHHTSQYFPFLENPDFTRNRTVFYTTLARMLFMEPHVTRFESFMQPFKQNLMVLLSCNSVEAFRQEEYKRALIAALRDLTGIVTSANTRVAYNLLFEWLYPDFMPVLLRAAEVWYDTPSVTSPLLKFVSEFVFNKNGRITFKSSSPNGILLFREASKLLVAYGQRVLQLNPPGGDEKEVYMYRYKGTWLTMQLLARALCGNYVNFGVFSLYGDPAFANALEITLQLALSIPFKELVAYPKLVSSYFPLINVLCQNHTGTIIELETSKFIQILTSIKDGLLTLTHDATVCSQCCDSLDHITAYAVEHQNKDNPTLRSFAAHNSARPELLPQLLEILFKLLLFEENPNLWSLSRPMLNLILLVPKHFVVIKEQLIANQVGANVGEKQQRLNNAFNLLMTDVKDNIMSKNRDQFTQNLTVFLNDVKTFIT